MWTPFTSQLSQVNMYNVFNHSNVNLLVPKQSELTQLTHLPEKHSVVLIIIFSGSGVS